MMEVIGGLLIFIGSIFILVSAVGILRMPDLYMRMSATTKASTLGLGLVLAGSAVFFGEVGVISKAIVIIAFLFLTAPVAAHLIGRAAYFDKTPLWEKSVMDDLKKKLEEEQIKNN